MWTFTSWQCLATLEVSGGLEDAEDKIVWCGDMGAYLYCNLPIASFRVFLPLSPMADFRTFQYGTETD